MKPVYHILMPFSRPENIPVLTEMIRGVRCVAEQYAEVLWHPLIHEPTQFPFLDWIKPFERPLPTPEQYLSSAWCYKKVSDFEPFNDDEYYMALCDDDAVESEFFVKLSKHTGDVVISSMKRGIRQPPNGHPTDTLFAAEVEMRVGRVGFEQIIMRGHMRKKWPYVEHGMADGILVESMKAAGVPFDYAPEAFVLFNFYEKGRW